MAEEPVEIEELFPDEEEVDDQSILEASNYEIEEFDAEDDVEVVESDPPPIGRAWLFDFARGSFVMDGRSPKTVRGDTALLAWVEKCMRTHRGDSVVHPADFGLNESLGDYIGGDPDELTGLTSDIEEALLFHPLISAVEDIEILEGETLEGDIAAEVSFVIVKGDGAEIPVTLELEPEAAI